MEATEFFEGTIVEHIKGGRSFRFCQVIDQQFVDIEVRMANDEWTEVVDKRPHSSINTTSGRYDYVDHGVRSDW